MYIEPVAPGTYFEVVVSSVLSNPEATFRVTTDAYPVTGDWKNVRLTRPNQIYKVGLISCLYQDYVVYQEWIETPSRYHGQFVTSDEVILPWFIYLDLYASAFVNEAPNIIKNGVGGGGMALDESGSVFSSMFSRSNVGDPNEPTQNMGLVRFVLKYKPSISGLMKPVDTIIVDNISDNVNIDLGIEMSRASIHIP